MPKRKPFTFDDIEVQLTKLGYLAEKFDLDQPDIDPNLAHLAGMDLGLAEFISSLDLNLIDELISSLDLSSIDELISGLEKSDIDRYLGL